MKDFFDNVLNIGDVVAAINAENIELTLATIIEVTPYGMLKIETLEAEPEIYIRNSNELIKKT